MKNGKRYNPNTFNAAQSGAAALVFWPAMGLASLVCALIFGGNAEGKIDDYSPWLCLDTIAVALAMGLLTLIFCRACGVKLFNGGGCLARKGQGMELLMTAVFMCGLSALLIPLSELCSSGATEIRSLLKLSDGGLPVDENGFAWWMYAGVLLPVFTAFFEELFFRGVVMRGFMQWGRNAALLISSVLFALMSAGLRTNADGGLFAHREFFYRLLTGVCIGFFVLETRNLLAGIVARLAGNLFVVVRYGVYLFTGTGTVASVYTAVTDVAFCALGAICLIAGILYFGKRLIYSRAHPDKSNAEIVASFIVPDLVVGSVRAEKPWFDCGRLATSGGEGQFFLSAGDEKIRLNARSSFSRAFAVLCAAFAIAVAVGLLGFFGVF